MNTCFKLAFIVPVYKNRARPHYFPLGYAYLYPALKNRFGDAIDIHIIDCGFRKTADVHEILRALDIIRPKIICFGGLITLFSSAIQLIPEIRKHLPDAKIILGGGLSASPDLVLRHTQADFLVEGEGETVLPQLVDETLTDQAASKLKGVYWLEGDSTRSNGPNPPTDDLDQIAFPELTHFRAGDYYNYHQEHPILSTRSCPFSCTFCYNPYGRKVRRRSVENLIEEIRHIHTRHRFRHFEFADDLFIFDRNYVADFCQSVIKLNLPVSFGCCGRVNTAEKDLYSLLRRAGFVRINFGFESGDDDNLKRMQKKATVKLAECAIDTCRSAHFEPSNSFIIGNFDESEHQIENTRQFILRNRLFPGSVNFMLPLPGTPAYTEALERKIITDEFIYLQTIGNVNEFHISLNGMPKEKLERLRDLIIESAEDNLRDQLRQLKIVTFGQRRFAVFDCLSCRQHNIKYIHGLTPLGHLRLTCSQCRQIYFETLPSHRSDMSSIWPIFILFALTHLPASLRRKIRLHMASLRPIVTS